MTGAAFPSDRGKAGVFPKDQAQATQMRKLAWGPLISQPRRLPDEQNPTAEHRGSIRHLKAEEGVLSDRPGKGSPETRCSKNPQKYFREESACFVERADARATRNSKLYEDSLPHLHLHPGWGQKPQQRVGQKSQTRLTRKQKSIRTFTPAGVMGNPAQT